MRAPGYIAETSLYQSKCFYRCRMTVGIVARVPTVLPQLGRVVAPVRPINAGRFAGGGRLGFECGGLACTCSGDADCNDMFSTGVCGQIAGCVDDGCWCLRL